MKHINSFYPCDTCGITPEETNEPHLYCESCEEFVGCEPCFAEHDLMNHGSDTIWTEKTEEIELPELPETD